MQRKAKVDVNEEGRNIKVWELDEGGYRYATTAGENQDPAHKIEPGSSSFFPPVVKGQPIEDSVDDLAQLGEQLVGVGFSSEVAQRVCAQAGA